VHESLPTESLMNCQIDDSLWCVTTLPNNSKLLIGVVYRSPSSIEANDSKLFNIFSNLCNFQNSSYLLIMGDFNVLNIDWQECMCLHNNSSFESKFLNATLVSFFITACHQFYSSYSWTEILYIGLNIYKRPQLN